MKYSGVEWIGEIPDKWNLVRLKDICINKKEVAGEKSSEYERLALTLNGVIKRPKDDQEGLQPKEFDTYQLLEENDFVFKMIDLQNISTSRVGLSPYTGLVSPAYIRFASKKKGQFNEFIHYYLLSLWHNCVYNNIAGDGVRSALNATDMGELKCPYPTEEQQRKIAGFLNKKTAEIDSLIDIENQQIEKLKEYKQAVITEAVTKGLDKNVLLKDSGVEWIGEIPVKWKCTPNKFLFQNGNGSLRIGPFGSSLRGKTLENGPYKIYNQAHLVSNDFSLNRHFISNETYEELKAYEVLPDDILFSMMGTIGKCRIMPPGFQKGIMDSHLLKARLNELILPKYYLYVFDKDMSSCVISQLRYLSNGSIMDGLNSTIVKKVYIPLPSIDEQKEIISFLDEKCSEIDTLISIKQKKIDYLIEYKKSLIYEYVTGKKEVC